MSASRNAVVYNETKSYDLPVFVIEPKIIDGKVYSNIVLDRCSIARNFNNVSYTSLAIWSAKTAKSSSLSFNAFRVNALGVTQYW